MRVSPESSAEPVIGVPVPCRFGLFPGLDETLEFLVPLFIRQLRLCPFSHSLALSVRTISNSDFALSFALSSVGA
jgi:hypothetical protein